MQFGLLYFLYVGLVLFVDLFGFWLVGCKWCFLVGCAVMLGCVALALCLLVVGFGVCVFGCAGFRLYLCCLVVVYLRAFVVA